MAISTKPKKAETNQDEAAIAELINKGGSVANALEKSNVAAATKEQKVLLRIPIPLLEVVDADLDKGYMKITRHRWIMDAIVEKLQRAGNLKSK